MEHIKSVALIDRLDRYLGFPKFDPHGDPIPNSEGKFTIRNQYILDVLDEGEVGVLVGVRNNAHDFLEYLNDLNIELGTEFKVLQKIKFDKSIKVETSNGDVLVFPKRVSAQLFVKKVK